MQFLSGHLLRVFYCVRIGISDLNFENVPIVNIKMASKKVFDLMEAEYWNEVMELLTNTTWTTQNLEEKHGVRSSIELFLRLLPRYYCIKKNLYFGVIPNHLYITL